jgi:hypothetical protein
MEKYLHDQLNKFNSQVPNKYRENWGSALQYLEGSTEINKKHFGEGSIYNNIEAIVNKKLDKHLEKVNLIN